MGMRSSSAFSRLAKPRAGGSGGASHSGVSFTVPGAAGAVGISTMVSVASTAAEVPPFSVSSRSDNCRASSLKALFSTGVSTGAFASPIGRNGNTFFGGSAKISAEGSLGVSTAISKSVCGEFSGSKASGKSGDADTSISSSAGKSGSGESPAGPAWTISAESGCGADGSVENSCCRSVTSLSKSRQRPKPRYPPKLRSRSNTGKPDNSTGTCPLSVGQSSSMPIQVSRLASACSTRPCGSSAKSCAMSCHGRPKPSAVRGPISLVNSSEPSVKRPSASVCQTKRSGCRRTFDSGSSAAGAASPRGDGSRCGRSSCSTFCRSGSSGSADATGCAACSQSSSAKASNRANSAGPSPVGVGGSGSDSDGGSETIGIAAGCGAASGGEAGAAFAEEARGFMLLAVAVATTSTPWWPSGKSSREQPHVISMPGAAPKPRNRSIRTAPLAGSWWASRATWRRCGSAGPGFRAASSALPEAPNTLAPARFAHTIRVPSADHSHAGRVLAACAASRGSRSTCPWNSLFIALK